MRLTTNIARIGTLPAGSEIRTLRTQRTATVDHGEQIAKVIWTDGSIKQVHPDVMVEVLWCPDPPKEAA